MDARPQRLASLDVLRGLAVIAMMMVDWPGSWDTRFGIFEHAHWTGITAADLIFPTFVFAMGVAVPFSLAGKPPNYGRILRRGALLLLIGYLLNVAWELPAHPSLSQIRIPGVLQRFGLVYPAVAIAFLHLRPRQLALLAAALLVGYWWLMTRVPVPGFGAPDLARYPTGEVTPNLEAWLDRLVLGHRVYEYPFDPEGILSTLPSIASALIGVVAGCWLREPVPKAQRARRLVVWGVALVVAGYLWGLEFPLCKKVWSSSFVLFTGGWALVFCGALFWVVEVTGRTTRALAPARWYGANALGAIVAFTLIDCVMSTIPAGKRGDHPLTYSLKDLVYDHLFRSWLPDRHASWVYSLVAISLLALAFRALFRRRILLRV
jgi:predicted acyltransferase